MNLSSPSDATRSSTGMILFAGKLNSIAIPSRLKPSTTVRPSDFLQDAHNLMFAEP